MAAVRATISPRSLAPAGGAGKGSPGAEKGKRQPWARNRGEGLSSWRPAVMPLGSLALTGTTKRRSSSVLGSCQPQGCWQHWSDNAAVQHKQKPDDRLRPLKHRTSSHEVTGASCPDWRSCQATWTKRSLGKGPISGFSNLIHYVAP